VACPATATARRNLFPNNLTKNKNHNRNNISLSLPSFSPFSVSFLLLQLLRLCQMSHHEKERRGPRESKDPLRSLRDGRVEKARSKKSQSERLGASKRPASAYFTDNPQCQRLQDVVTQGDYDTLSDLLNRGADPSTYDSVGRALLHLAAAYARPRIGLHSFSLSLSFESHCVCVCVQCNCCFKKVRTRTRRT